MNRQIKIAGIVVCALMLAAPVLARKLPLEFRFLSGLQNTLQDLTSTELGKLDGATVTTAEINLTDNMIASITAVSSGTEAAGSNNDIILTAKDAAGTALATAGCSTVVFSSSGSLATPSAPDAVTASVGSWTALGTATYHVCYGAAGTAQALAHYDGDVDRYVVGIMPSAGLSFSGVIDWD